MKECYKCDTVKPIDLFVRAKRSKEGRANICKECRNIYSKSQPNRSKRERQLQHIKHTYKLTEKGYLELLHSQDYKCKVCNKELQAFTKNTHIDHCHDTGNIRGMLCRDCNCNLGFYEKFKRLNLQESFDNYILGG